MLMAKKTTPPTKVESIRHKDKRANIPTEELRDFMAEDEDAPKTMLYPRDPSLDPQLVWKGKDEQDREDLAVPVVPIYIQEKIHPQAIINALPRIEPPGDDQPNLFADFNGGPVDFDQKIDFYHHEQNWTNCLILGDSLLVMTSLAEKEGLKGKVQTIYVDPPYGIKFGSNWQVSTRKRDVKDGKAEDATRQPEQVRAFRDTWKLGIHSYLAYLRDRLVVARDLLTETGSIFVQIGDENVHLVRCVLDEVFGSENCCSVIVVAKASAQSSQLVAGGGDFLLWYSKSKENVKYHELFPDKDPFENPTERYVCIETPEGQLIDLSVAQKRGKEQLPKGRVCRLWPTFSQTAGKSSTFPYEFGGITYTAPLQYGWQTTALGLARLKWAGRLYPIGKSLRWKVYHDEFPYKLINNIWLDLRPGGFGEQRVYVVQTSVDVIARCILMTTDPGDLVLDPTCGSGTTAYIAEQWGRR
jgi:adenine-specific DNA-methyltransferase